MATLPYAARTPGLYQAITTTTDSDAIAVPEHATGVVLYFDNGGTMVEGRVAFSTDNSAITVSDTNMGWHPAQAIQSDQQASYTVQSGTKTATTLYLHVACATAGAIAKGFWLSRTAS